MNVYSLIYIVLAAILLLYTAMHRMDLLCVAAVCYIVYTIYCIPGIGISGFYRPKLSPQLYWCVYSQLLLILLVSAILRNKEKRKDTLIRQGIKADEEKVNEKIVYFSFLLYTAVIFAFALVNIVKVGFSGFASGKLNVWEQTNVFYVISLYGTYPAFAYGIHKKKKLIWIPCLFVELTIFFAGSRAFAATMVIIFLCERGSLLWKNRKKNFRIYILGALAVLFLLIYRMVDKQIMSGNIEGVFQTLSKPSTWAVALEFNEPRVIIANYDYVLTQKFRLPAGDVVYRIIDFIPGLSSLLHIDLKYPEYFSAWLQQEVHGSEGVGGTIWGESYAMFGYPGVFFATILWLVFVKACSKHLNYSKSHSYFVVAIGTYLSWYINRLDYNRVGQACKVMLFCFLIWSAFYLCLGGVFHFKKTAFSINKKSWINQTAVKPIRKAASCEQKSNDIF